MLLDAHDVLACCSVPVCSGPPAAAAAAALKNKVCNDKCMLKNTNILFSCSIQTTVAVPVQLNMNVLYLVRTKNHDGTRKKNLKVAHRFILIKNFPFSL
jgi:hypothetical protein